MIETLQKLLPLVLYDIDEPEKWDSLIVNKRKPHTFRVFRQYDDTRVCLHAFNPCESDECFVHPHPWPGAFLLMQGAYVHSIGLAPNLVDEPQFFHRQILRPYSIYEITDRREFHSVQPLERTYTIMANGQPWENTHAKTRTTKNKDLDKMSPEDLRTHLKEFEVLLRKFANDFDQGILYR